MHFHMCMNVLEFMQCAGTRAGRSQRTVLGGILWVAFAFHLRKSLSLSESSVKMAKPAEKQSKDLPVSILPSLR